MKTNIHIYKKRSPNKYKQEKVTLHQDQDVWNRQEGFFFKKKYYKGEKSLSSSLLMKRPEVSEFWVELMEKYWKVLEWGCSVWLGCVHLLFVTN